jgi:hypothetical protein
MLPWTGLYFGPHHPESAFEGEINSTKENAAAENRK